MLDPQQASMKKLEEANEYEEEEFVGDWEMIPAKAFLFFPSGQQIKIGSKEKQWRKIFENNQPYDEFEEQNLLILEKKLKQYKIQPHPWFNRANKLRVLQAHKFKITDTCTSIKQGTKWRSKDFPIHMDHRLEALLASGCGYYCGRDRQYRPILAVDIAKFKSEDEQYIPTMLMVMLQYMIDEMLIEGQVQNYVIILDLSKFEMGMKSTVTKILSFTSNTYRGRLFACYLLGMPSLLKFGWDAIASKFVSQNTLKKIKITKQPQNPDMWAHIDKSNIEVKFGGTMENMTKDFWPPSKELMNWKIEKAILKTPLPGHITKQNYEDLYMTGNLKHRKVYYGYIHHIRQKRNKPAAAQQVMASQKQQDHPKQQPVLRQKQKGRSHQLLPNQPQKSSNTLMIQSNTKPFIPNQTPQINSQNSDLLRQPLNITPITQNQSKQSNFLQKQKLQHFAEYSIKKEKKVTLRKREFKLMFEEDDFLSINGLA